MDLRGDGVMVTSLPCFLTMFSDGVQSELELEITR